MGLGKTIGRALGRGVLSVLHTAWDADGAQQAADKRKPKQAAEKKRTRQQPTSPRPSARPTAERDGRSRIAGDDKPVTDKQVRYIAKLARDAGRPIPDTTGLTAAKASAVIEHLGGRKLEAKAQRRREQVAADRVRVSKQHAGRTRQEAGGGAAVVMDRMQGLRGEIAAEERSGHPDPIRIAHLTAELEDANRQRQDARQACYEDRYRLERRLQGAERGSREYDDVLDQLATVEDQLRVLRD
ncbi:DUF3072 domain-containing protein [Georgenia yuyongxinii]|uniref:DUF3072 domain-containing protein n=1 Tax=Georgenia yuyongxinii TaxID=2589797 RepID=A0A552WUE5_9MICO|nr:DUF3072 domain-containing protein [Georgenia yuyongxinii]TRW46412.1 DUF3072 domain-containing protein [Georgenia yuyongxinii]